jgi:hypothetical protein
MTTTTTTIRLTGSIVGPNKDGGDGLCVVGGVSGIVGS